MTASSNLPATTRRAAIMASAALGGANIHIRESQAQRSETVLRVGMTASDIPSVTGQPDQGSEGWRFTGVTLYDGLVNWDLSRADRPSTLAPGLATHWQVDAADRRRWVFTLRPGVKFHDGSDWNADAAIWNLVKLTDQNAPQYDRRQVAQTYGRMGYIAGFEKLGEFSISISTHEPDALLPYYFGRIFFSSPTQWEKVGRSWEAFARAPSGTGPWKFASIVPRQRLEMVKNTEYWDQARVPKTDRLVLLPIPDANTRVAALLSGQVDWIEAPPPDAVPRLRQQNMQIVTNSYQHTWPWVLNLNTGSPFADIRVRKALNLGIDRAAISNMLGGFGAPAVGQVPPGHPWFGNPSFRIRHDPAEARRLLAEAGFGPNNPVRAKIIISASGSGQMQPMMMNEAIQEMVRPLGIEISFEVVDWAAMVQSRLKGSRDASQRGLHGLNYSWVWVDPDFGFITALDSRKTAPRGNNWGYVEQPEFDAFSDRIRAEFDPAKQDQVVAEMHTRMVDECVWLWVVHDMNARAMTARVKGFVQAQNWIQDLTPVRME
ncbi:ABC transporter substrate-binding protein [Rhodovarius lipocyclicus]|uniref:ABC transporter substrate-binding protein n=1 Tax=Rhodovarius lipocyclicus TaxID=268410 RepID=UPI00135A2012|nr:ABC transporter substrate-binding protein [Rhodovarius lipocyclicus]